LTIPIWRIKKFYESLAAHKTLQFQPGEKIWLQ
jgi:hypothetical protein